MVSARGVLRTEGFRYALDNGAWTAFQRNEPFDVPAFERAVLQLGSGADWIVLPDIVMGGRASLDLSVSWLKKLRRRKPLRHVRFMLVVQNGMDTCRRMLARLRRIISRRVGVFVGGDTEWKLRTMSFWARFAHERGAQCHVGRVNSARRARACDRVGVDSFDGSGPSRFEKCLHQVDAAFVQRDLVGFCERLTADTQGLAA